MHTTSLSAPPMTEKAAGRHPIEVLPDASELDVISGADSLLVEGDAFDDASADLLATRFLPNARSLRRVCVASVGFSPFAIRRVLRALLESPSAALSHFTLRDVSLPPEACGVLARVVAKHGATLQRLRLSRCKIDDASVPPVTAAISCCEQLEELFLDDNDAVAALAEPMDGGGPLPRTLRVLDVSGNRIEQSHFRGLGAALRPCAAGVEELYLARCCVTAEGLQTLWQCGLHASNALRVLNLTSGRLLESAGPLLCSILTECMNLERLYVNDNFLGPDGAARMAVGFMCAKRLSVLGMGKCYLGSRGVIWIAEALKECPALRELDLSENNVKDGDVHYISTRCVNGSVQLKLLDLSNNPLTDACRPAIRRLMDLHGGHMCHVLVRGTEMKFDSAYIRPGDVW